MRRRPARAPILPRTLEVLILRVPLFGPDHRYRIAKHIRQTSEDVLQVEHGALFSALEPFERDGLIVSGRLYAVGRALEQCRARK